MSFFFKKDELIETYKDKKYIFEYFEDKSRNM